MESILYLSIFWTVYGIVGLLGYQVIPVRFKGYSWTKDYIRSQGKGWLILGVLWLVASLILRNIDVGMGIEIVIFIVLSLPPLIYACILEKKYDAMT